MYTDDTFMGGGSRRVNVCILTTPLWGGGRRVNVCILTTPLWGGK